MTCHCMSKSQTARKAMQVMAGAAARYFHTQNICAVEAAAMAATRYQPAAALAATPTHAVCSQSSTQHVGDRAGATDALHQAVFATLLCACARRPRLMCSAGGLLPFHADPPRAPAGVGGCAGFSGICGIQYELSAGVMVQVCSLGFVQCLLLAYAHCCLVSVVVLGSAVVSGVQYKLPVRVLVQVRRVNLVQHFLSGKRWDV